MFISIFFLSHILLLTEFVHGTIAGFSSSAVSHSSVATKLAEMENLSGVTGYMECKIKRPIYTELDCTIARLVVVLYASINYIQCVYNYGGKPIS